jgi:hypothetical protein
MKYEVIKQCFIKGERQNVGDVIDIDENLGNELCGYGRLVPADEGAQITDRSVGLPKSKPKAKPRTRKPKAAPKAEVESDG